MCPTATGHPLAQRRKRRSTSTSIVPPEYQRAFQKWGPLADAEAKKYGLKDGATLLAKIGYVESRYNMKAVSPADARGAMQFIPETREGYINQYGIDPWADVDQAVHAAAIYMKTSGLDNYNPGSSTYISEVLKAPIGSLPTSTSTARPTTSTTPDESSPPSGLAGGLLHAGLVGGFVLGGVALVGVGTTRLFGAGSQRRPA